MFEYKYNLQPRKPFKAVEDILRPNLVSYESLLKTLLAYWPTEIPRDKINEFDPYWYNSTIPCLDALSFYNFTMMRAPATIIEIGSGNSTKFFRKAITVYSPKTRLISIDPEPRCECDTLCDEVIRQGLETADLSIFEKLGPQDIVFFDGTHRSFTNSDVTTFFLEVVPIIPKGVWFALHDIFLPEDYADHNYAFNYYNEQYLLASMLLGGRQNAEIILPMMYTYKHFIPDQAYTFPDGQFVAKQGSTFWMEKL